MCGIFGVVASKNVDVDGKLKQGARAQSHRGPDMADRSIVSSGVWDIGLAHQRLSILDLTPAGKQPMWSQSRRSLLTYNGEIYNFPDLKGQLTLKQYETDTDTEVLLEAIEELGIGAALNACNGMWALAWYDSLSNKIFLARDRVGIKPLYYHFASDGSIYFASEVKAILAASPEKFALNYKVVSEFVNQSLQDNTNESFFRGIYSLPAGCYAEIDLGSDELELNISRYWDINNPSVNPTGHDNVAEFRDLFDDAVKIRMRSDVPVGVTLSGGLDSSAISIVMKNSLSTEQTLNILSAVSPGSKQDETEFIDIMGQHLQSEVNKVELGWGPEEAIELMKQATWHNDSPLGSFSNVAHYLLMKKARDLGVTVILSGQGADELLCGYKKYLGFFLQSLIRRGAFIRFVLTATSFLINRTILTQFNLQESKRYLPKFLVRNEIDIRGPKLKDFEPAVLSLKKGQSMQERQKADITSFSVPFLTHYEDRMSMAWSREIRLPFLDYRIIEFLSDLPVSSKLKFGWTKYILRQAFSERLPKSIVWRRDKQGFVNPQESWLKNELRPEILEMFGSEALVFKLGLIDRESFLKKYKQFCAQHDNQGKVWYRDIFNPFALEIWLQINSDYIEGIN